MTGPYFFLAAVVFGLDAGFFFAAGADTPKTDSFSALAGVKRSRVRAGILICSPVAGLRTTGIAVLSRMKNHTRGSLCRVDLELAHYINRAFGADPDW